MAGLPGTAGTCQRRGGSGRRDFLDNYETHQVGGRAIVEYWIPAGDLTELNANIVGRIEVTAEYHKV